MIAGGREKTSRPANSQGPSNLNSMHATQAKIWAAACARAPALARTTRRSSQPSILHAAAPSQRTLTTHPHQPVTRVPAAWAAQSGRSLETRIYNRNRNPLHRLSRFLPIRHYCSHLQDIAMGPTASIENPDQYRLPTDLKPTHYDVVVKTDLEALTFQGVVTARCVYPLCRMHRRSTYTASTS